MEELLMCSVCVERYHEKDRHPVLLPRCGHSFCRPCITMLSSGGCVVCPACRMDQRVESIERLPTQFTLLAIIHAQESSKKETCTEHDVKLSFWCQTCRVPACGECLFEDHPTHSHDVIKASKYIADTKGTAREIAARFMDCLDERERVFYKGVYLSAQKISTALREIAVLRKDFEEACDLIKTINEDVSISSASSLGETAKFLGVKWNIRGESYETDKQQSKCPFKAAPINDLSSQTGHGKEKNDLDKRALSPIAEVESFPEASDDIIKESKQDDNINEMHSSDKIQIESPKEKTNLQKDIKKEPNSLKNSKEKTNSQEDSNSKENQNLNEKTNSQENSKENQNSQDIHNEKLTTTHNSQPKFKENIISQENPEETLNSLENSRDNINSQEISQKKINLLENSKNETNTNESSKEQKNPQEKSKEEPIPKTKQTPKKLEQNQNAQDNKEKEETIDKTPQDQQVINNDENEKEKDKILENSQNGETLEKQKEKNAEKQETKHKEGKECKNYNKNIENKEQNSLENKSPIITQDKETIDQMNTKTSAVKDQTKEIKDISIAENSQTISLQNSDNSQSLDEELNKEKSEIKKDTSQPPQVSKSNKQNNPTNDKKGEPKWSVAEHSKYHKPNVEDKKGAEDKKGVFKVKRWKVRSPPGEEQSKCDKNPAPTSTSPPNHPKENVDEQATSSPVAPQPLPESDGERIHEKLNPQPLKGDPKLNKHDPPESTNSEGLRKDDEPNSQRPDNGIQIPNMENQIDHSITNQQKKEIKNEKASEIKDKKSETTSNSHHKESKTSEKEQPVSKSLEKTVKQIQRAEKDTQTDKQIRVEKEAQTVIAQKSNNETQTEDDKEEKEEAQQFDRSQTKLSDCIQVPGFMIGVESEDGRMATLSWGDQSLHVHSMQAHHFEYDILIRSSILNCLIPAKSPTVFLELSSQQTTLGRIYLTLWGHLRRSQNFMTLCLGDRGASYADTKFLQVYNVGTPGERILGGDYESNSGRGGKGIIDNLEVSPVYAMPMEEGMVTSAGSGQESTNSLFLICTRSDESRNFSCPFGTVSVGLDLVSQAVQMISKHEDVFISDCGVSLLPPIEASI